MNFRLRSKSDARASRFFASAIATAATTGLAVQFAASLQLTGSVLRAVGEMLRYFTILANVLVALVFAGLVLGRPAAGRPALLGGTTLCIALVGVTYALLLRGLLELSGGARLADYLLHYVTPLAAPVFWLTCVSHGGLRWRDPLMWLSVPCAYFIYALVLGAWDGRYPYPFMNPVQLGWSRVILNGLVVAALFTGVSYAVVWLDRRLAGRRATGRRGGPSP